MDGGLVWYGVVWCGWEWVVCQRLVVSLCFGESGGAVVVAFAGVFEGSWGLRGGGVCGGCGGVVEWHFEVF